MKKVNFEFFTRSDRHETIGGINEAVSAAGGYVDDVNFFSNIAVAIIGVFPPDSGKQLAEALLALGLKLSAREMSQLKIVDGGCLADEEFTCGIHVTFVHEGPDLRQRIPSVPG